MACVPLACVAAGVFWLLPTTVLSEPDVPVMPVETEEPVDRPESVLSEDPLLDDVERSYEERAREELDPDAEEDDRPIRDRIPWKSEESSGEKGDRR